MTSKELNEIINKTRRTPFISLPPDQWIEIVKDLEMLEELKKIMGTPIQDIMKRLKILEILKKAFKSNSIYLINLKSSVESERITQEEYDLINEYLEKK